MCFTVYSPDGRRILVVPFDYGLLAARVRGHNLVRQQRRTFQSSYIDRSAEAVHCNKLYLQRVRYMPDSGLTVRQLNAIR